MKKIAHIAHIVLLTSLGIMCIAAPLFANAQSDSTQTTTQTNGAQASPPYQYQANGIYGCNKTGAAASSVGAFVASGAYVPVSDAAVELNTGYLVYLECSLRPLVDALSGSATAGLIDKITKSFTQGNNGNPYFSVNARNEDNAARDKAAIPAISVIAAATGPTFQSAISTTLARSYAANTQNPLGALACPYSSSQISSSVWTAIASIGVPTCDVLIDYENAYDQDMAIAASAVAANASLRQQGNGVYPITTTDANGNVNIVTPGAVVLNQAEQALQAGFTKTENANDIGQMVTSLFAGIGAQALSSAQGLAGLTQSGNGVPSYLDQVATAASQNVATNAINAAITVLNGVLTTVTNYQNSLNTIANTLLSAINTLKGDEAQCWNSIIQNVCAGAVSYSTGGPTCTEAHIAGTATSTLTVTLKIATSTAFSHAVISSQIAPLANQTATDINSVQGMINEINTLIAGVTNTTSQAAQNAALQQLDQLTASNSFPSPTDLANAQQEATSISAAMQTLVSTTVQNWEGADSNGQQTLPWDGTVSATTVGWCDYNDPGTLLAWESLWKR